MGYWRCNCGTGDCVTHKVDNGTITIYPRCTRSYWVETPSKEEKLIPPPKIPLPIGAERQWQTALCDRWPPIARARGPPKVWAPRRAPVEGFTAVAYLAWFEDLWLPR